MLIRRKTSTVKATITEPFETSTGTKVGICLRIVSLKNTGKTSRVPVQFFNMSAKVLTLSSKSTVCQLQVHKFIS